MSKLSFIGIGNMGKAMLGGILKSGLMNPEDITAVAAHQSTLDDVGREFEINTTMDSLKAVEDSDIVILAVKPEAVKAVLEKNREKIDNKKIILSVAAAVSIDDIEGYIGDDKKIVRIMPNTPALVGEAMSAVCINKNVKDDDLDKVLAIVNSFGKSEIVSESLIDSVVGVSGSSPAYVFMFVEAMADAAVLTGMSRKQAYKFAAQAVYGSAKMIMETGMHPGELKDMVCSPGGTTIVAVENLEKNGLRNAVIQGQLECVKKSIEMAKK